jgi:hypothetical protein
MLLPMELTASLAASGEVNFIRMKGWVYDESPHDRQQMGSPVGIRLRVGQSEAPASE